MREQVIVEHERSGALQGAVTKASRYFRIFTGSPEARVRAFYDLNNRRLTNKSIYRDFMDLKSLYVNFGYWEDGCDSHDEACEALAERLAEVAGISNGDRVLDVGFGYAEQDFHWMRTRKPELILGINVSPGQVDVARRRAAELNLDDKVDLRVGSATALPVSDESFDRVVALEASVHFDTRQKFFEEAFRVLRPGGTIATTDPTPRSADMEKGLRGRAEKIARRLTNPDSNWYDRETYAQRLKDAGFVNVNVRNIADKVYRPEADFTRRRFDAPENQKYSSAQLRSMRMLLSLIEARAVKMDYVLTSAQKPEK